MRKRKLDLYIFLSERFGVQMSVRIFIPIDHLDSDFFYTKLLFFFVNMSKFCKIWIEDNIF